MTSFKVCTKCKQILTKEKFSTCNRSRTGLQSRCKSCYKAYYKKNKQKILVKTAEYRNANADKLKKYEKNRATRRSSTDKLWYAKNRKKRIKQMRKWKKDNKKVCLAHNAKRRAARRKRTPKWVDLKAITQIYKNCPPGMHVDHIIPLNGAEVSGLHVPWNLQYLTPEENLKKSNKLILPE